LEVAVTLFANPKVLTLLATFVIFVLAFVAAATLIRRIRRRVMAEALLEEAAPSLERLPLHTYNAVIQQLKQQKHELLTLQQSERWRAKTSENISAAVLSNLSSGVLFLTTNGLVRRTNAAARTILGYASPNGMSTAELFRDATVISAGVQGTLSAFVQAAVRRQGDPQKVQARYFSPAGEHKILDVTVTCVRAQSGEVLGTACLINDETEVARLQNQQQTRRELSSEMALALRMSLATISGYARQLADTKDPETARQFAADIVSEAAQLDHTIGGFLAGTQASARAAGA
jgi:nitrogen fixation/metabolism regulation signal transduction histidine kinase